MYSRIEFEGNNEENKEWRVMAVGRRRIKDERWLQ
jgi:hypothetical protein